MFYPLLAAYILIPLTIIVVVIGLTQPTRAVLSKSIVLKASIDKVFQQCISFQQFVIWSPWSAKDPTMEMTFSDEVGVVGAWYKWKGNRQVGMGSMTILEVIPNKQIKMELNFGFRTKSIAIFEFESVAFGTNVTWSFESEVGKNPVQRSMIPFMVKLIGKDFEQGLINLKKHCDE